MACGIYFTNILGKGRNLGVFVICLAEEVRATRQKYRLNAVKLTLYNAKIYKYTFLLWCSRKPDAIFFNFNNFLLIQPANCFFECTFAHSKGF